MRYKPKQYAEAFHLAISEVGEKGADKVIDTLLEVLKKNGDLSLYESITEEFEKLAFKEEGRTKATISMANDLSLDKEMLDDLNKIVGKKLDLEKSEESYLVGGIVLRTDDVLFDASIKGKLKKLQESMIK